MRKRMTVFLVVLVGAMLSVVPAATAITLSSVQPGQGYNGDTVTGTVYGSFHFPSGLLVDLPAFTLVNGTTIITLTTTGLLATNGEEAYVTFAIPREAALGVYTLNASQTYGFWPSVTETLSMTSAFTVERHPPLISSLNPPSVIAGGGDLTLTVYGDYFIDTWLDHSQVRFNGVAVATTYNSPTVITATVPAAAVATPGVAAVTVHNPGFFMDPGELSDPYTFTILAPSATITALEPPSAAVGGPAFSLGVAGTGFVTGATGAVVTWNGVDLVTTRDSAVHLTAVVPAPLIAAAGSATIAVRNGTAPAAPLSNSLTFTVSASAATITALEPAFAAVGGPAFNLGVAGTGFVTGATGAVVTWNGVDLVTTRDSAVHLTAVVPAPLIAAAGSATVAVRNGTAPAAPLSNSLTFTVTPAATITALEPASASVGGPAFNLGVVGTSFVTGATGAVVTWNGVDLVTTRDSAVHLTAAVPAPLIAAAGSATIAVRNGTAPAAPLSSSLTFTVANTVPALTSISPTQVWAGYVKNDLVLTVNGSSFLAGAHIFLSGGEKTGTTFVSASQLTVPLVAADVATPISLTVSVKNPPFPPGTSSAGALPLVVAAETTDPAVTIAGAGSGWHNTAVPLTFSATDGQSGVQKVQYRSPPTVAAWTDGTSYTVPVTTQGAITVNAQALDWCNKVGTASATVNIDTTKPTTAALNDVSVKRNKTAKLKFSITEPAGLSPSAKVVIEIKRSKSTAKTITIASAPTNAPQTCSFKCKLAKGTYKWYVSATDLAGNPQANVASATLKVK